MGFFEYFPQKYCGVDLCKHNLLKIVISNFFKNKLPDM